MLSNRNILAQALLMLAVAFLTSCKEKTAAEKGRAMYYWSTTFRLDSTKQEFLEQHNIKRLYVRYFDVIINDAGEPMPNATIQFDSAVVCRQEIVPTVFIHNDCMRQPPVQLAEKLLARLLQMNETHHIGRVGEIQIDCDWTQKTRQNFFAFLEELHKMTAAKGITLSATIRLHQLSQPVPPVDCGVLMVYNTGDLTKLEVEKPILDINDVKPYLKHLKNYDLKMAAAFPIYKWELVFRHGKFVDILHDADELPLLDGDTIVTRCPTLADSLESKKAIGKTKPDCLNEIILFDLNNHNINRFSTNDYEEIYN